MSFEDRVRDMLLGKEFKGAERVREIVRLFFRGGDEVTLHAMCLVRVLDGGRLVASSADAGTPAIDVECQSLMDCQWDKDYCAYDFCIKGYLGRSPRGFVGDIQFRPWGDMILSLDNDSQIHILTDSALEGREQWRLYQQGVPGREAHIVRCASGFALE